MIVANRVNSTFIFRGDTSSRGMKLFLTFSHMPNFLETCRKIEKFFFFYGRENCLLYGVLQKKSSYIEMKIY